VDILPQAAVFFAAAVLVVPIFRKFGMGAVLGYLAAGAVIGPFGLSFINDVDAIMHFAEFGVVLLLFIIGLELQPKRLWTLRNTVFGLGGAQVALSAAALGIAARFIGLSPALAIVVGLGLALSSTAFVLQTLAERDELKDRHGRAAFAILLFQDIAAIPILAIVPLLATTSTAASSEPIVFSIAKVTAAIIAVIVGGHFLLSPVLKVIAATRTRELFTATALLIVAGTALLMDSIGISMALGAFMAGVLLANSEYRHALEADIEPFKGLLLGLFFMSVGMGLNLGLLQESSGTIALLVVGVMFVKGLIVFALARVWGLNNYSATKLGMALPQGGEFAFVIFATAVSASVMDKGLEEVLTLVVSMSMAATPIISLVYEWMTRGLVREHQGEFDEALEDSPPIIIAGFGRFGQIVGRVLAARRIPFTALDSSPTHVDFIRKFGGELFYGDASRVDLLRAAKADEAAIIVLAIADVEASLRAAETVIQHFPNLQIYARARNRAHSHQLMDLGVKVMQRDTLLSSLALAQDVLVGVGMKKTEAIETIKLFRAHDENALLKQYPHYRDQEKLRSMAKSYREELEELFSHDAFEHRVGLNSDSAKANDGLEGDGETSRELPRNRFL
jgi:glutathione-regulated potassium-efflux system ancillary protein KefC